MIATDVASRGLDIPDVELVIQLAPPISIEPYIHRSGRSGRAGKPGTSITFFDSSNADRLARIESEVNIKLKILKQSDSNSLVAFCEKLYNLKKQI